MYTHVNLFKYIFNENVDRKEKDVLFILIFRFSFKSLIFYGLYFFIDLKKIFGNISVIYVYQYKYLCNKIFKTFQLLS